MQYKRRERKTPKCPNGWRVNGSDLLGEMAGRLDVKAANIRFLYRSAKHKSEHSHQQSDNGKCK
jgi:hypothetical protein